MLKSNRAHKKFLYSIINTKYNIIIIEEDIDTMYHENYIKAKNSTQSFCHYFHKKDTDVLRIISHEIKCCQQPFNDIKYDF